jgi:hypothetical protein
MGVCVISQKNYTDNKTHRISIEILKYKYIFYVFFFVKPWSTFTFGFGLSEPIELLKRRESLLMENWTFR